MQETACPLCFGPLEVRDVAPCCDCGGEPKELVDFREGVHTYSEYEVFPGLRLVLCNFCDVDFGSYDPSFFGLSNKTRIGFDKMHLVKVLRNPSIGKDKFCPSCGYRLAFLRFVLSARAVHTPR